MCKVSRGDVQSLPIPLPPMKEQKRIVSELRKSFEKEAQFKSCVSTATAYSSNLMSSILTKAFQGLLVPQDPGEGTGLDLVNKFKHAPVGKEKQ